MTAFTSFPDHPLKLADTRTLDASESIDVCKPLLGLQPTPEADIVAIYLGLNDTIRLITYEDAGGWEEFEQFAVTDTADRFDTATDRLLEWGVEYYGEDQIVFLETEPDQSLDARLLDLFPPSPIGRADLEDIGELPGIDPMGVGFCFKDTHEIIATQVFAEGFAYALGFNPDEETWEIISSVSIDTVDATSAELTDRFGTWVFDHHPEDRVQAFVPEDAV